MSGLTGESPDSNQDTELARARHTPGSLAADGIRGPGVTRLSGLRKTPNLTSLRLEIEPCQLRLNRSRGI